MRKIVILLSVISTFIFSGCYFHNTPIFPSAAGFHFSHSAPFGADEISGMANNGSTVVAVSHSMKKIACSADSGVTWAIVGDDDIEDVFADKIPFNAVAWGEGYFLAVGDEGRAAFSEDGVNWQAGVIGPMSPKNINCVAIGRIGGRKVFAAGGPDGRLAHAVDSPAGPWYMANQPPLGDADGYGEDVHGLAFGTIKGAGIFVAVCDHGKIVIKQDIGDKWYGVRNGPQNQAFRTIAFGNDRFIAAGDNGLIKYSLDPSTYAWKSINDDTLGQRTIDGIAFDPLINHFILFTADTVVGYSEFGDSWNAANFQARFTAGTPGDPEKISAVSCTALRIVIGGSKGTILYSN